MSRRGRANARIAATCVAAIATTLLLAGGEFGSRTFDPRGDAVHGDRRWRSEVYSDHHLSRQAFVDLYDLKVGPADHVDYLPVADQHFRTLNIDNDRLRGPEITTDTFRRRVLVSGGSFVFGVGATGDERTIAGALERLLRSDWSTADVEVANLGVSGFVTSQQVADLATRGLDLRPTVIIFIDGLNDIEASANGRAGNALVDTSAAWRTSVLLYLLNSSLAERALIFARERRGPTPLTPQAGLSLDDLARETARSLETNVTKAARIAQEHGIRFVHFVQPTLFTGRKPLSAEETDRLTVLDGCGDLAVSICRTGFRDYFRLASDQVRLASARLKASGVASYDLTDVFNDDPATEWIDEAHLGDRGYQRIAEAIIPDLRDALAR